MRICILLAYALLLPSAFAYQASWDGNHPEAKAEAWTWAGHVREVAVKNGKKTLGAKGYGFLYYYARSEEKAMGSMTFRSSATTETAGGEGKSFKTDTVYAAKIPGAEFRARTGRLDLAFNAGPIQDRVTATPMTAADTAKLNETLTMFPGLQATIAPKKISLRVTERDGSRADLVFYAIWPVLSSKDGTMRFLGQEGTYSFSEPMLVTVGTYKGREVAGLSFCDRQWARESFGVNVIGNLSVLLRYAEALSYSHAWSGFHAQNLRTNEWSFFHLWRQWRREPGVRDRLTDYSGMLWMKNGRESGLVPAADYVWEPAGFAWAQGRSIMLDYAAGRAGFFPSRADVRSRKMGLELSLYASPFLQNLNQPIHFYEGYAEGEGRWNGDELRITGRLESSRLMFRPQDYEEMIEILRARKDGWDQPELQTWLRGNLENDLDGTPFGWLHGRLAVLASLLGELDLKLAIFGDILAGTKPRRDGKDPAVTIYY